MNGTIGNSPIEPVATCSSMNVLNSSRNGLSGLTAWLNMLSKSIVRLPGLLYHKEINDNNIEYCERLFIFAFANSYRTMFNYSMQVLTAFSAMGYYRGSLFQSGNSS